MEKGYAIGEISKLTGMPISTLRYYDTQGIYEPAMRSDESGYRYYTSEQFWHIELLTVCKEWNLSLESIKAIMNAKDDFSAVEVLKTHKNNLKKQINALKKICNDIEWLDEQVKLTEKLDEQNIEIRHLGERNVICAVHKGYRYGENGYQYDGPGEIELRKNSSEEFNHHNSIKSKYGFIGGIDQLETGEFNPSVCYINLYKDKYRYTEKENVHKLPAGEYVCFKTQVVNNKICGAEKLLSYLRENDISTDTVILEERGFSLVDVSYIACEVQILIK
jgi:DNA-binding transcriptional MerR regulator